MEIKNYREGLQILKNKFGRDYTKKFANYAKRIRNLKKSGKNYGSINSYLLPKVKQYLRTMPATMERMKTANIRKMSNKQLLRENARYRQKKKDNIELTKAQQKRAYRINRELQNRTTRDKNAQRTMQTQIINQAEVMQTKRDYQFREKARKRQWSGYTGDTIRTNRAQYVAWMNGIAKELEWDEIEMYWNELTPNLERVDNGTGWYDAVNDIFIPDSLG